MNDTRRPIPSFVMMIILFGVFAFAAGGYILFYQSQKRIVQKDHEYIQMKDQLAHERASFDALKKQIKQRDEDVHKSEAARDAAITSEKMCRAQVEELKIRADSLQKANETLQKSLNTQGGTPTGTQPGTATPPTGTAAPSNQTTALQCPSSADITTKASTGSWELAPLKWWVDYASRPLDDHETVGEVEKILYDGQTVSCYYALSGNSQSATVIVVKGASIDKKPLTINKDGWKACATGEDCKQVCEKENIGVCRFSLETTEKNP